MKRNLLLLTLALCAITSFAKDIKNIVVTTNPQMHCESCEDKIKNNMRLEKGIKGIETNISRQEVTLTYDADKTTPEKLIKGFEKIGYTATEKTDDNKQQTICNKKQNCCKNGQKGYDKKQGKCENKLNCCKNGQKGCDKKQGKCENKLNCCKDGQVVCNKKQGNCENKLNCCENGQNNCDKKQNKCKQDCKKCSNTECNAKK